MIAFDNIANAIALLVVVAACVVHYAGMDKTTPHLDRWGFIFIGAGSFGQLAAMFSPRIESFPFELVMHAGMAMLAVAMVAGHVRGYLARKPMLSFIERRRADDKLTS